LRNSRITQDQINEPRATGNRGLNVMLWIGPRPATKHPTATRNKATDASHQMEGRFESWPLRTKRTLPVSLQRPSESASKQLALRPHGQVAGPGFAVPATRWITQPIRMAMSATAPQPAKPMAIHLNISATWFTTIARQRPISAAAGKPADYALVFGEALMTSCANRFRFCSFAVSRNWRIFSANSWFSKTPTQETRVPFALGSNETVSSKCGRLRCLIRISAWGTISRNSDWFG